MGLNIARVSLLASAAVAALLLAGCQTLKTAAVEDEASEDALVSVLSSYQQTEASGQSISEAQAAGAVSGFAVATGGALSAASTTGTFTIGSVELTDNGKGIIVTVGDRTYELARTQSSKRDVGGMPGQMSRFGNTGKGSGDGVMLLNSEYVSLAAIVSGGGKWQEVAPGQFVIAGADGYGMLVTGVHTPVSSMPNQKARYEGEYYFAMVDDTMVAFGDQGDFFLDVNFDSGKITGAAYDRVGMAAGEHHTAIKAKIVNGNQFAGTLSRLEIDGHQNTGANGEIIGGFFGPNAEQVAGTATGIARPEAAGFEDTYVTGVFLGSQKKK